jgi:hypothetical protein
MPHENLEAAQLLLLSIKSGARQGLQFKATKLHSMSF